MENLKRPTKEVLNQLRIAEKNNDIDTLRTLVKEYDWRKVTFEKGGNYGLLNCFEEEIAPAVFEDFKQLELPGFVLDNDKIVAKKDGKWGLVYLDGTENWLIPPIFDDIGYPGNKYTYIKKNDKYGVLNTFTYDLVLNPIYDEITHENGLLFTHFGYSLLLKDGKYGAINEYMEIIPPIYENIDMDENENLIVEHKGKKGYVKEDGQFTSEIDEAYFKAFVF